MLWWICASSWAGVCVWFFFFISCWDSTAAQMEKGPLEPGGEGLESLGFGPGSEFCNWAWKTRAASLIRTICQPCAVARVQHQLPFLTLPKMSFVEQYKKRASHMLVVAWLASISAALEFWFFCCFFKTNVCQGLNDFDRLQHNSSYAHQWKRKFLQIFTQSELLLCLKLLSWKYFPFISIFPFFSPCQLPQKYKLK